MRKRIESNLGNLKRMTQIIEASIFSIVPNNVLFFFLPLPSSDVFTPVTRCVW